MSEHTLLVSADNSKGGNGMAEISLLIAGLLSLNPVDDYFSLWLPRLSRYCGNSSVISLQHALEPT